MPTGYTADIAKGISFKQYALNCARAFGALIEMRDEPVGAPIPQEFKPSDYHLKAIKKAEASIAKINAMPAERLQAQANKDYRNERDRYLKAIKDGAKLKAQYESMLAEVVKYKAPSTDHEEFAKFMRDQITGSIEFDCGGSYYQDELRKLSPKSGKQWQKDSMRELRDSVNYHHKEHEAEVKRCADRTAWVNQLFSSLEAQP